MYVCVCVHLFFAFILWCLFIAALTLHFSKNIEEELSVMNKVYYFPDSYGRVYTADPYHAALAPAAYGVGAMVSPYCFRSTYVALFYIFSVIVNKFSKYTKTDNAVLP